MKRSIAGLYYDQKPPRGAIVDPWSPFARSLVGCWLFNEGGGSSNGAAFDIARRQAPQTIFGSLKWSGSDRGMAMDFGAGGTNTNYWTVNAAVQWAPALTNSAWTTVAYVNTNSITSARAIICYGEVTDSNATWCMGINASGQLTHMANAAGDATTFTASTLALPLNAWSFVAISQTNATLRTFYVNGQSQVNTATIGNNGVTTTGGLAIAESYVNSVASAGGSWGGLIAFIYSFNRALDIGELHQLYKDPYGMIKQPHAREYIVANPVVAAGVKFRKTLSSYGSGVGKRQTHRVD